MALDNYEKLIYTNSRGDTIELGINSEYYVNVTKDVTGISDIKNTIYSTSSMGQHGKTYISQTIDEREIDITGYLNTRSKDRARDLRRAMQRILNPELNATLTYVYKDFKRIIDVKANSAPVFQHKKVLDTFTIQLVCPSPFWRELTENKQDVASWIGCLEFPVEIDAVDGMMFGFREPSLIVDVYNEGDVETGMRIVFAATGTVSNPLLLNINTGEFMKVNATLKAGDVVTINTAYGSKGATLYSNGVTTDFFRFIDVDSTFMQMEIGDNIFRYDASGGLDQLEVTIYHSNQYLGV